MSVRITDRSKVLLELPIILFLRLADGDGKMTAREMERFDALLGAPGWCRSSLLRRSLGHTQAEKASLWRRYIDGDLHTDSGSVEAALDTVLNSIPVEDLPDFRRDLLYFARELLNAANGAAGLFRSDAEAESRFETLVELIKRPSARTAETSQAESCAAPAVIRASCATLLVGRPNAESFWEGGKLPLHCVHVMDETHDTKTFQFVADPPKLFRYYPGQFITLEIPIEGKIVRRSYTISTSPSRPYSIGITVKRVEGGRISKWLHENMRPGVVLFADGPNGKFTCIGGDGGPYLFLSGGSGITPVMSMSRWLCDTTPNVDIHFVHAARTPDDLIFGEELRLMERQFEAFRCDVIYSRLEAKPSGRIRSGRISAELLGEIVPDLKTRAAYLCGPVPFMEAARDALGQLGYGMSRFRQESFGGVPRIAKQLDAEASAAAKVLFSDSGVEVECKGSDYILDVALEHGVQASFSCRAGQCGACKVILAEGSVAHDCTDALTQDDVDLGVILSCQARPVGRVVVHQ